MSKPTVKYLKDYQPCPFTIEKTHLTFELDEKQTLVTAVIHFKKNLQAPETKDSQTLKLNGVDLKLHSIKINDKALDEQSYETDETSLVIHQVPDDFTLETVVEINPGANTSLEGLYKSGNVFCTQCESHGFRKITYYLDRPDVMTVYTVKIIADKSACPVILSNGDKVDEGQLNNNKHYAVWKDPFNKPSYLFALVAGDLSCLRDTFTTRSDRAIDLEIYAFKQDIDKCHHAMEALKQAMTWDEKRFNLEYDLNTFMIVAVPDFNAGAMENKGLNIFNTKFILANNETATDKDFEMVQGVVGHEYFHNWTGNRVTCRDWFQLSLKEGLTVFRDQEFTSDHNSRDVKRINDVKIIRSIQFAEDAGPMAHPIRPESYIEMNNFYTVTVYNKGAEVIRMIHTLLGEDGFQKGMQLYFERHDGQAVTCEDFVNAMADANERDLSLFKRWYGQSGTPIVIIKDHYDEKTQTYTLTCQQNIPETADQKNKSTLHIPLKMGLIAPDGTNSNEQTLELTDSETTFTFDNVEAKPVPSLFRDFSAPVKVKYDYQNEDLLHIIQHDNNAFNRWNSIQTMATTLILNNQQAPETFIEAIKTVLDDQQLDKSLISDSVLMPSETALAQDMDTIMVDELVSARQTIIQQLAEALKPHWLAIYEQCFDPTYYKRDQLSVAKRRLKGVCLFYLMQSSDQTVGTDLALELFSKADNMTDQLSAFSAILQSKEADARQKAIDDFYDQWQTEDLVINKWLSLQAWMPHEGTVDHVRALMDHSAFNMKNPNKVFSLIGAFGGNFAQFHKADGSGYQFMAEATQQVDAINPQIASRLARNLDSWKRYDPARQQLMKDQLTNILNSNPSKNVYEIVDKALKS